MPDEAASSSSPIDEFELRLAEKRAELGAMQASPARMEEPAPMVRGGEGITAVGGPDSGGAILSAESDVPAMNGDDWIGVNLMINGVLDIREFHVR